MNNDIVSGMFVMIAIILAIAANFARSDLPQAALTLGTALVFAILSINSKNDYEE